MRPQLCWSTAPNGTQSLPNDFLSLSLLSLCSYLLYSHCFRVLICVFFDIRLVFNIAAGYIWFRVFEARFFFSAFFSPSNCIFFLCSTSNVGFSFAYSLHSGLNDWWNKQVLAKYPTQFCYNLISDEIVLRSALPFVKCPCSSIVMRLFFMRKFHSLVSERVIREGK